MKRILCFVLILCMMGTVLTGFARREAAEATEAETEETETIAELKPVEDTTSVDIGRIIAIAGAVVAILIASVAVVLKLKKK